MRSQTERDLRQESKNQKANVKVQKQHVRTLQTKLRTLNERCDKVDDTVDTKEDLLKEIADKQVCLIVCCSPTVCLLRHQVLCYVCVCVATR